VPRAVHSLDLRIGVDVVRTGRYTASVMVDAFNLIESEIATRHSTWSTPAELW
jgi:hypothetical protein